MVWPPEGCKAALRCGGSRKDHLRGYYTRSGSNGFGRHGVERLYGLHRGSTHSRVFRHCTGLHDGNSEKHNLTDNQLVDALFVSALLGVIMAERDISYSGSVGAVKQRLAYPVLLPPRDLPACSAMIPM